MQNLKSRFDITKEEAFELGRIEGLKEAFREMEQLSATEITFFRVYIKARIKSIEENIVNIERFKNSLRN